MASRISVSSGSGLRSSSARAVSIIPGVQNPHCRPCSSMKPCCTGSRVPFCAIPSTVRTSCPSAMAASTVHDFTGCPSIRTTQVPQLLVSQPQWVPVMPSVSRRKCTSSSRGSTSLLTCSPLIVVVICTLDPFSGRDERAGARYGEAQDAPGELVGEVPLVVDRTALVLDGGTGLGGDPAGLGEQVLARLLLAQDLEDAGHAALLAERGQADGDVADPPVVLEDDRRPGGGDRPVPH